MSIYLLYIILGGFILTAGDLMAKQWLQTDKWSWFVGGIILYTIGAVLVCLSFKGKNIAVATMIFVCINVISLALVSWFWYGEKLTPIQIGAMVMALTAVLILEYGH
jgi:multidrug transporter EmrE-like cation transporter